MKAKQLAVSTLVATALAASAAASAENACKGLSESACDDQAGCGWVQGYTRKDGREVAPYCRAKGKKPSLSAVTGKQAPPEG
jgi:hypothetical protein